MNKTLNINLAGFIFHVDEDAYTRLENYLNTLKAQFVNTEGGKEIISDIEMRIAELFKERTGEHKDVINAADVDQVIAIMGQPEDYLDLGEDDTPKSPEVEFTSRKKRIFRDTDNRIIGGVAAGIAAYFNIDSIWIRLVFILLFLSGFGFLFYIIMWLIIPKAQTTAEKLQMRGEKVNISNIERSIRDEMQGFSSRVSDYDYKKTKGHLSSFFTDFGDFIMDALKLIFKVVGKLFGIFFLLIGFLILVALIVALFAGGVEITGSGYALSDLFDFFELVTVSEGHYNLLLAGITLSVIAPFFLLFYFGIRLLFQLEPLNAPTRSGLVLTTFLGLIFLVVSGVKIGLQFDRHAETTRELPLSTSQNYSLVLGSDSLNQQFSKGDAPNWIHHGQMNAFNHVSLDIKKAATDKAYLKIYTESQGHDRKAARYNGREIAYNITVRDSTILIPNHFVLKKGQKYRGQNIRVILFLPEGSSAFIDESVVEVLDDVENLQNTWDLEMGNTRWIMTQRGLSCAGCAIPEYDEESTEYDDDLDTGDWEVEESDDQIKIRSKNSKGSETWIIDENGIRRTEEHNGRKEEQTIEWNDAEISYRGTKELLTFTSDLEAII
jgi:phage shock protein PspC (stress-responsive transcriptional regulator)